MRFRRVPVRLVRSALTGSAREGLDLTADDLQIRWLAGGDLGRAVAGARYARRRGVSVPFQRLAAADLGDG